MHSLLSVVAPSIAMMLILIVAGSVAHEVMTANKSGSAGDECASLSISTALTTALSRFAAFKCVLFFSGSFTSASVFETEGRWFESNRVRC